MYISAAPAQAGGAPSLEQAKDEYNRLIGQMIAAGEMFYRQNWVLGTSGNFSAVFSRKPFELAITGSGAHKGTLTPDQFLRVNDQGQPIDSPHQPSAETAIHLAICAACDAGAILHTHSVWSTLLSDMYGASGGLELNGYEMLKGLSGVTTHLRNEWIPILENSQDYSRLSREVFHTIKGKREVHGILLRRHGLYTWGRDLEEARRHVEVLEFLFEVIGRQHCMAATL